MSNVHVKAGDTVMVNSGKYKGVKGEVVATSPKEGKVIVEGINFVTKHVKPRRMGEQGTIVKTEAPVYACKVMAVCPKCGKPTKPSYKIADGKKTRCCKKCGAEY